ncbi:hypothetical protein DH86_00003100 [Scytalidium sp. 3C]|nr:hypothetical protein DH86_00003100 [Scytalidium sp. 3C]
MLQGGNCAKESYKNAESTECGISGEGRRIRASNTEVTRRARSMESSRRSSSATVTDSPRIWFIITFTNRCLDIRPRTSCYSVHINWFILFSSPGTEHITA